MTKRKLTPLLGSEIDMQLEVEPVGDVEEVAFPVLRAAWGPATRILTAPTKAAEVDALAALFVDWANGYDAAQSAFTDPTALREMRSLRDQLTRVVAWLRTAPVERTGT